jgi:hypothetical protein
MAMDQGFRNILMLRWVSPKIKEIHVGFRWKYCIVLFFFFFFLSIFHHNGEMMDEGIAYLGPIMMC